MDPTRLQHRRRRDTGQPRAFSIVAPPEAAGMRADRFLADAIGTLSRTPRQGADRGGAGATRDGARHRRSRPSRYARARLTSCSAAAGRTATPQPQAIPFDDPVSRTRDLIVLDKPAGLVVHPAPGNEDGTLVNALLAHCGDSLPGIGGERRPGIVHRLDRDTSGVMVVAKTEHGARRPCPRCSRRATWNARIWRDSCGACRTRQPARSRAPIGRDPRDRKRMAIVTRGGRQALTRYRTLEVFHAAVSLLECTAGDRAHAPDPGASGLAAAIPWWAIRCICGVFLRSAARCRRSRCGRRCWIFRARRCMPQGLASGIPGPAGSCCSRRRCRRISRRYSIWRAPEGKGFLIVAALAA